MLRTVAVLVRRLDFQPLELGPDPKTVHLSVGASTEPPSGADQSSLSVLSKDDPVVNRT
jgi:hypothetical protein